MATRAVATIVNVTDNNLTSASNFTIHVNMVVIGSDFGDLGDRTVDNFEINDLDPEALALTLRSNVAAAVKTYLLSMNVPFGLLDSDTVRVLSSIL